MTTSYLSERAFVPPVGPFKNWQRCWSACERINSSENLGECESTCGVPQALRKHGTVKTLQPGRAMTIPVGANSLRLSNAGAETNLPGLNTNPGGGSIAPTGDNPPGEMVTQKAGVNPLIGAVIGAAAGYWWKKDVKYAVALAAAGYVGVNYTQNKTII